MKIQAFKNVVALPYCGNKYNELT